MDGMFAQQTNDANNECKERGLGTRMNGLAINARAAENHKEQRDVLESGKQHDQGNILNSSNCIKMCLRSPYLRRE